MSLLHYDLHCILPEVIIGCIELGDIVEITERIQEGQGGQFVAGYIQHLQPEKKDKHWIYYPLDLGEVHTLI